MRLSCALNDAGCEVVYHDIPLPDHADAQFTHDPSLVCDQGAIILSMGKALRRGEEQAQARCLKRLGVPVHFRLHGEARGEGGDMLWLDQRTLLVGLGFSHEYGRGAAARTKRCPTSMSSHSTCRTTRAARRVCTLMSFISMLDRDLAVVHLPLMPVRMYSLLRERGVRWSKCRRTNT